MAARFLERSQGAVLASHRIGGRCLAVTPQERAMRPHHRARWSSSILFAILASLGVARASWAQAPAGAPPAVPPAPVPAAPVYVPPAPASPPPAAPPPVPAAPAAVPAAPAVTPPPAASMPMVPVATPFKVETPTGT